ncbi:hypothetical protein GUA87_03765 [Sneathiella sp. P13V-1]|uniref:hypothetical protein n=1 Tax=Sneathiella sp. P13V-1 TaxID=2697366 RepID=UPI00187BB118|nr:hypothetical protein [Sneathiella sp. P13V-1]MBE7635947.1 hypothetical protein [Sneathiella sp. P13V-1]
MTQSAKSPIKSVVSFRRKIQEKVQPIRKPDFAVPIENRFEVAEFVGYLSKPNVTKYAKERNALFPIHLEYQSLLEDDDTTSVDVQRIFITASGKEYDATQ